MLLRKAFPLSICLMRCLQTSNIWTSVVASPPSPAVASTSLSEMLTHSWAVCSSVFENCLTFPWLPWNSDIPNPIVQNAGSRRRRWYSFTQLYYFLPLVLIPEAEDYFQMCPAASPVITWILGRTTQRCGLGIFVPLEAMCGLSFDIEKKREKSSLVWLIENMYSVAGRAYGVQPRASATWTENVSIHCQQEKSFENKTPSPSSYPALVRSHV